ncbi:TonB-dependent receptor [Qipengyuania sp. 6B39]|uniref:TonB-dependent receptor n=1 Tax=Qipengyuania proteolytica TaxID=2867239 RepID=UPI001C890B9D|nr:TonB-dependent receptor [Qipengyuania proteolytica]MBX7497057.1 TonB-dependent receptor [Qipengyuania proteolytica]
MKFKYLLAASVVSTASAMVAAPAAAQSTGSVDFEDDVIIVSGARETGVGGVEIPDTPKAKQVLDEEIIRRQRPGQTVNDIVNLVPGVSFQNNDPWGSSGGTFTIRGFSSDRISQTLDGLPLNDSGNYALYTNQQVDPEVLEQVNVNLGVTDVDSPTASAVGGTINIRTREPSDDFGITATLSVGDTFPSGDDSGRSRLYMRGFGMIDTGDITGFGTKAFFSASYTRYNNPFNNYGRVDKQQYNGRIWQDIGDNGDFVSVSGHYNQNRNNFFGSFALDAFPQTKADRFYTVQNADGDIDFPCTLPEGTLFGGGGVNGVSERYSDSGSTGDCGATFDRRYNPSNTGNIRGASRFTFADNLVLTVDPSYQYVKANGGGVEDLREGFRNVGGVDYTGFIGGGYYFGRDLNGDGDLLDSIAGTDPSHTETNRFGVIASLAYEISPEHRVRLAYTWDRARHRQTGSTTFLLPNGEPADVFPINDPLETSDGFVLNKRDRLSYAILNQISGEYRGEFGALTAVLGLRAPFFKRELNQNCFTTTPDAGRGFIDCLGDQDTTAYEAANPDYALPQSRTYKYDKLLPNVGFTYALGDASIFGNYAKGLSVPGTDPLYASLYFPADTAGVQPAPETTDSFDLGLRWQSGNIQAQLAGYYTMYDNRLATAYDPEQDTVIFRNLGRVDKYGLDASISWRPTNNALLYVFGSITESEIKENLLAGTCSEDQAEDGVYGCQNEGDDAFFQLAGKNESGAPTWSVGARGQLTFGDFEFGAQVKHTGKRYVNDENLPILRYVDGDDLDTFPDQYVEIYGATAKGYTTVDLDVRWTFAENPFGKDVALQLNVTNLFDELYVGGFGGSLDQLQTPFVQIGPPRAASLSLIFGY